MHAINSQISAIKLKNSDLEIASKKANSNSEKFNSYLDVAKSSDSAQNSDSTKNIKTLHLANLNKSGELEVNKLELKSKQSAKIPQLTDGISRDDLVNMPNLVSKSIKDGEVVYVEGMGYAASDYATLMAFLNAEKWRDEENQKPFSITKNMGLDMLKNSISLVMGVTYSTGASVLDWLSNRVEAKQNGKPVSKDTKAYKIAQSLNFFTRIANGEMTGVFFDKKDSQRVAEVLKSMGIDLERDFFVNGKKFWFDKKAQKISWNAEVVKKENHFMAHHYIYKPPSLKERTFGRLQGA